MTLTFTVVGLPGAQGSKRSLGNGILIESSKAVKPWRQDCKHAALQAVPPSWDRSVPICLSIVFRFNRPAGHFGKRGLKPSAPQHLTSARAGDIDKLCRSTLDALTGVAYDDDRQVVMLSASKRYCTPTEHPGAVITLIPL